jgi:type II secretory pathway predicted ATPase ExeA
MTLEHAFAPAHSRKSFLETPALGEALRRLDEGLGAREPFLLVTGDPGTGKSALAHEAIARWGSRITSAFLTYSALTGSEFLEEIVRRFGADPPANASRSKLLACVERVLGDIASRNQVGVLVVDDAHELPAELLVHLRLLVNAAQVLNRPFEVVLIGLPALEMKLEEPELVTLRQRIAAHVKLEPLLPAETRSYLHHRIGVAGGNGTSLFTKKTCRDIAARTRGVPRQINALAAEALRVARAASSQVVGPEHVQTAAAVLWGLAPADDNDSAIDVAEDSPAATTAPAAAAIAAVASGAAAPAPRPSPTPPSPKAAAPIAAPARPAAPVETRPAPKAAAPTPIEEDIYPVHTPPAHHDPREWVVRFVGDKGPIRIGSHAVAESLPALDDSSRGGSASEPAAEAGKSAEDSQATRKRPERPRTRSQWKPPIDSRMAITAALATVVVVGVVALLIRASGHARSGAEAVATATAPVAQDGDATPASDRERSRTAGTAPKASVAEPSSSTDSRGPFTLDVGGPFSFDRALDQRVRMQELTGFEGWVVPAQGQADAYRVVVGVYRSRERATSAANMLLRSKTLPRVVVVPLPPRDARR